MQMYKWSYIFALLRKIEVWVGSELVSIAELDLCEVHKGVRLAQKPTAF